MVDQKVKWGRWGREEEGDTIKGRRGPGGFRGWVREKRGKLLNHAITSLYSRI